MFTEVLPNEQSLALFIPKLEETMAGYYYCSAFYANTEQMDIGVKIETFGKLHVISNFLKCNDRIKFVPCCAAVKSHHD